MSGFSAQVCTGGGLLARFGDTVVLAPSDSPLLDELLALARDAGSSGALPRKVAGLLAQSDEAATLALACPHPDGLAVLLAGDVTLTLADGTSLSGRDASTWVDRIVRSPWTSLQLALSGAGPVDPRSDLQGGTVTAGGVQLSALSGEAPVADHAPAPPVPVVAPSEPAAFESFSLTETADEPLPEPLPVAAAPAAEPAAEPGGVTVQGIECSRGHFNDPTAIYCSVCGISMVHQTHNLVPGRRPPLGVLVLDDGAVFTVDGDYVLGREPDQAPEVQAGTAKALPLDDPEVTMSRVHAKILLSGWEVRLVDSSANGSYVVPAGQADWTKLPAGEQTVLRPGTRIALGGRTMVFDSHHKL